MQIVLKQYQISGPDPTIRPSLTIKTTLIDGLQLFQELKKERQQY